MTEGRPASLIGVCNYKWKTVLSESFGKSFNSKSVMRKAIILERRKVVDIGTSSGIYQLNEIRYEVVVMRWERLAEVKKRKVLSMLNMGICEVKRRGVTGRKTMVKQ